MNGLIEQRLLDGGGGGGGGGGSDDNGAVVVQNADGGSGLASNVLSDDVMNKSVPGNIRRAEQTVYSPACHNEGVRSTTSVNEVPGSWPAMQHPVFDRFKIRWHTGSFFVLTIRANN